jgi:hypothetical protein
VTKLYTIYRAKYSKTYPVGWAEVDSFSKVVAIVEASVIGSGEGDDKLACLLVCTEDLSTNHSIQISIHKHVSTWMQYLTLIGEGLLNTKACYLLCCNSLNEAISDIHSGHYFR